MAVARHIRHLYKRVVGEQTLATDGGRVYQLGSTYGELTPAGTQRVVEELDLSGRDVFYDLGSGVGKVVLQVAMSVPVRKCVGVEYIESRCRAARRVLREARSQGLILARRTSYRAENFVRSNIADATAVFACSTCYSRHLMVQLARKIASARKPVKVVTTRDFHMGHRGFEFVRRLRLRTSWSRFIPAYSYRYVPPATHR